MKQVVVVRGITAEGCEVRASGLPDVGKRAVSGVGHVKYTTGSGPYVKVLEWLPPKRI